MNIKENIDFKIAITVQKTIRGKQEDIHLFDLRVVGKGYWYEDGDIDDPKTLVDYEMEAMYLNDGKENILEAIRYFLDGFEYSDIEKAVKAHCLWLFRNEHEALLQKLNLIDDSLEVNDEQ